MELTGSLSPSQSLAGNLSSIVPPNFRWTLLASKVLNINCSSSSAITAGNITSAEAWTSDKIIVVRIRDKEGKQNGYFLESDTFFINKNPSEESTSTLTTHMTQTFRVNNNGEIITSTSTSYNGVYADSIDSTGKIVIKARCLSGTISGNYLIEVYALDYPDGVSPFAN